CAAGSSDARRGAAERGRSFPRTGGESGSLDSGARGSGGDLVGGRRGTLRRPGGGADRGARAGPRRPDPRAPRCLAGRPRAPEPATPNLVRGDQLGGSMHLAHNFFLRPFGGWSRYRTPIEGLYLCGAATWPGAGVGAGSGYLLGKRLVRLSRVQRR